MSTAEALAVCTAVFAIIGGYARLYYQWKSQSLTLERAKHKIASQEIRISRIERYLGNKYKFWKDTEPPDTDY